jgi:hypothetical protein
LVRSNKTDKSREPRVNLTHDSNGHCQFIEDFDKEAAARGLNIRKRVALLQEALPWWDPETGNLATQGRATGIQ